MQPLKVLPDFNLQRITACHARRREVEQYVSQRYAAAFDAHLQEFMPEFLVMMDAYNRIQTVCGFRSAAQQTLFLEQYLPQPVERIIANTPSLDVERTKLVEFGQLASFSYGCSCLHFYLVLQALLADGYRWGIFTATDPLFALLRRFGLKPTILAPAQAGAIPNAAHHWGTYYDYCPRIMMGDLSVAIKQLELGLARRGMSL